MPEKTIIVEAITAPQHVYAGQEAIFTFSFNEPVKKPVTVFCSIWESVHKINWKTEKPFTLKAGNPKQAEFTLAFTEATAGARLTLTFALLSTDFSTKNGMELKETIEVKRRDGLKEVVADRIYWAEPELARWNVKSAERKSICKNEYGFLHIHTRGLYGHEIWYELLEGKSDFMPNHKAIRDNVVSIPVSMEQVWADRIGWYNFISSEIKIKARAHHDQTQMKDATAEQ